MYVSETSGREPIPSIGNPFARDEVRRWENLTVSAGALQPTQSFAKQVVGDWDLVERLIEESQLPVSPDIRVTNVVQEFYESSQIVPLKTEDVRLQVSMTEKFQKELQILVVRAVEPNESLLDGRNRNSRG